MKNTDTTAAASYVIPSHGVASLAEHHRHASGRRKTVCTSAVLAWLGVDARSYNYCATVDELKRLANRGRWSLRSVKSKLLKKPTVGNSRALLAHLTKQDPTISGYVVHVRNHVLALRPAGTTAIDTAARLRDSRAILGVYAVRSMPL